jgi:hypothetical protein
MTEPFMHEANDVLRRIDSLVVSIPIKQLPSAVAIVEDALREAAKAAYKRAAQEVKGFPCDHEDCLEEMADRISDLGRSIGDERVGK